MHDASSGWKDLLSTVPMTSWLGKRRSGQGSGDPDDEAVPVAVIDALAETVAEGVPVAVADRAGLGLARRPGLRDGARKARGRHSEAGERRHGVGSAGLEQNKLGGGGNWTRTQRDVNQLPPPRRRSRRP